MIEDIEVEIEIYQGYRNRLKTIRCTDFRVRRHLEISKREYTDEGLLIECLVYNKEGSVAHQTELGWDSSFEGLQHILPSGYTYKLERVLHRNDDDLRGSSYRNSIIDKEGRSHGFRTYQHGCSRWVHGHPETAHEMYIYEHNNISEGRVFFTPLGDGLYLLDYYYIDCDQEITERFYNIYRLDPHGNVNLVFEKKFDHTFAIREKGAHERYIDYNIPVQFMFQHYITPTQDRKLYALQKKEVDAYLETHGFRPEDYNKSAPYYESYMEYYNQKLMQKEDKYGKEEFELEPFTLNFEEGEWRLVDEEDEEDKEDDI
jgi:hypothetical protein